MNSFHAIAAALALSLVAAPALAEGIKAGDLTIEKPWARATPKGADVGAAYVEIRNAGGDADKLTGGSADFANVEIHEMSMQGNVMKMQRAEGRPGDPRPWRRQARAGRLSHHAHRPQTPAGQGRDGQG